MCVCYIYIYFIDTQNKLTMFTVQYICGFMSVFLFLKSFFASARPQILSECF